MAEESIFIESGGPRLEGLIHYSQGPKAVVVSHPHPFYGGDMFNNVVESILNAYQGRGYTTLRFNFRGVGQSGGTHDGGISEQEDVRSCLEHVAGLGKTDIDLGGYSFGSWVNCLGLGSYAQVKRMIMISPPVNFLEFSFLRYDARIQLVIAGSEDDIAPPAMIERVLPVWNAEALLEVIEGADHFYWDKTGEIEEIIGRFLDSTHKPVRE